MSNPYQQPDPYGGNGYGQQQPQQPQQPGYGYPQAPQQPGYGYPQAQQPYPQAPQPYPPVQHPVPQPVQQPNSLANASVGLGVVAMLTFCWFGWLLGLVGVGLGIAALNKSTQLGGQGRGVAMGGVAVNTLALLIGIAYTVLIVVNNNR